MGSLKLRRLSVALSSILSLLGLCGCATTERLVLQSKIDLHKQAIAASNITLDTLKQNSGGPGPFQVKAYVSIDVVNRALASVQGMEVPIPGIADATAKLNTLHLSRYGSFPVVDISVSAQKGSLVVQTDLAAILVPTGQPGEMKLRVLSFVPDVKWWRFEFTKAQFIQDLLTVELDKLADRLPLVELPTKESIALGGPAYDNVVRFQATPRPSYITVDMNFPATAWSPQLQNIRYYYLGKGIYVFGDIP